MVEFEYDFILEFFSNAYKECVEIKKELTDAISKKNIILAKGLAEKITKCEYFLILIETEDLKEALIENIDQSKDNKQNWLKIQKILSKVMLF
jgi:hypothetical protein